MDRGTVGNRTGPILFNGQERELARTAGGWSDVRSHWGLLGRSASLHGLWEGGQTYGAIVVYCSGVCMVRAPSAYRADHGMVGV
jgi:hypothetical protein